MNKIRIVLILIILDLMAFFSILKLIDLNTMLWWAEGVVVLVIISLLYFVIDKSSKGILRYLNNLIKLNQSRTVQIESKFNELISGNVTAKEEIKIAFKGLSDNQNTIYEKVSNQQCETIKSIETLANINENMNTSIKELLRKEQEFMEANVKVANELKEESLNLSKFFMSSNKEFKQDFDENNNKLNKVLTEYFNIMSSKVNYSIEESTKFVKEFFYDIKDNNAKGFEQIQNITSDKIDEMKNLLVENNTKTQETFNNSVELFQINLSSFEEKNNVALEEYNRQLVKDIGKNIKEINKQITRGNEDWKEITEQLSTSNVDTIKETYNLLAQMVELHNDLLKQLNENQTKMMELNGADIELMRDIIK